MFFKKRKELENNLEEYYISVVKGKRLKIKAKRIAIEVSLLEE